MARKEADSEHEVEVERFEVSSEEIPSPVWACKSQETARSRAPTFRSGALPSFPPSRAPLSASSCRASAPKACLYRQGCDWSVGPVIHRKHRMQTVT